MQFTFCCFSCRFLFAYCPDITALVDWAQNTNLLTSVCFGAPLGLVSAHLAESSLLLIWFNKKSGSLVFGHMVNCLGIVVVVAKIPHTKINLFLPSTSIMYQCASKLVLASSSSRIYYFLWRCGEEQHFHPLTAPACKMSGLKSAHIHACKQYNWWSYNKSTFNTVHFGKEGGQKTLMVLNLAFLLVVFWVTHCQTWQWKGERKKKREKKKKKEALGLTFHFRHHPTMRSKLNRSKRWKNTVQCHQY